MNEYGLDANYFAEKLKLILRDISRYTPAEIARELARMSVTADKSVLGEDEFAQSGWLGIDTPEDISIAGEEILLWDGCEHHIDYVDCDVDTGASYMANGTEPTHWMPLPKPPEAINAIQQPST